MALNVLIVDDSSTFRSMVHRTLDQGNVPIRDLFEAANGEEGLKVLERNWVDLVIVDVNMPVMTGSEMVERMKDDSVLRTIPVVLLTSEGSTPKIAQLRSQGVSAYLRKPCNPEEIRDTVLGLVGSPDRPSVRELLQQTFSDIMRNLAYLVCEPESSGSVEAIGDDFLEASIDLSGTFVGNIRVIAPLGAADLIARNLLGIDDLEAVSPHDASDALGEVLNITSAHFVPAVHGSESVKIKSGVPSVTPCGTDRVNQLKEGGDVVAVSVDGEP
ncbi:MAG: response regulator, partial [Planctomycetota bacterium]